MSEHSSEFYHDIAGSGLSRLLNFRDVNLLHLGVNCLSSGETQGYFIKPKFSSLKSEVSQKVVNITKRNFEMFKIISHQTFHYAKNKDCMGYIYISLQDMYNEYFFFHIHHLLETTPVSANRITFIFSNTVRFNEEDVKKLQTLTELGFHIGLDDFTLDTYLNESLYNLKYLSNRGIYPQHIFLHSRIFSQRNSLFYTMTKKVLKEIKTYGIHAVIGKLPYGDDKITTAKDLGCNYVFPGE